MSTLAKYLENPGDYLMKLYKRGKDFYENDRKKIYDQCTAHAADREPRYEIIEPGSFVPKFPAISPAIQTRLAAMDDLKNEAERFYVIEPYYPASQEEKEAIEKVVERRYARLDYMLDKVGFAVKSSDCFLNAETYPVAWMKVFLRKDYREVFEMESSFFGLRKRIVKKEKLTYIGVDFETLQPEQVLFDGQARREDYEYCEFIGQRDNRDISYVLYKWRVDLKGNPITKERLESLLTTDQQRHETQEAKGLPDTEPLKGVEIVELEFRLYDESDQKLKLRAATFIPGGGGGQGEAAILLEDDWRWLEGEASCTYLFVPFVAERLASQIEGRSPVQKGIPLQQDILDFLRMLMEALARDIHGREYAKQGTIISPTERTAAAGRRTIVREIADIKFDVRFNPNVSHFIDLIKLFNESLVNVMAADTVAAPVSLANQEQDETATLTNKRAGLFNSRLGRTFKNYARSVRQCVWLADEILKQIYAEGYGEVFEKNIYGLSSEQTAEMSDEDMFFPVTIKELSFESLAKREVDKLIWSKFFKDLFPVFQKPMLSPEEILMIEEYWRAFGKSEKTLQQLLARKKALLAQMEQAGIIPEDVAGQEGAENENGAGEISLERQNPALSRVA